jgi:hypothetical protein
MIMEDHYNRPSLSRGSTDTRSESGSFAASSIAVSEAASSQSGKTLLFGEISSDGKCKHSLAEIPLFNYKMNETTHCENMV